MSTSKNERLRKPLILIAEDIPRNMEIVFNILNKEGYRIAMAGNGTKALEMIPEVEPDLILLDVMMPGMNGFDVCINVKENPKVKDIPIIFLTAKAESNDIIKGLEIGAVDYVTKPFNAAELISRVKTHLDLKFSREAFKELNATKDKFFSILAHDLRNPLQVLLFAADLLHNDYDVMNDENRKKCAQGFYENTKHISSLLENILEWAQSQSGNIQIRPTEIDLALLVEECLGLSKESAQKKEIGLTSKIEPGVLVYADKNMIHTVLRNLLANAVKFTHPGGDVSVDAALSAQGNEVEISVTDNGIGIPAQDLDSLFRIDVRKSTKGTLDEKGTGLGLILCKEFVEKNDGTISVTCKPTGGTSFKFTLPAAPGDLEPAAE